ncbi:MAG: hypothetical protein DPW09_32985 [Anaerolineae bacterium]|nr:PD40 domain-containing protein [Anaerolineales bacterium]MCQ3978268.1 hypothetical protein [Anaerolineae bacterium]
MDSDLNNLEEMDDVEKEIQYEDASNDLDNEKYVEAIKKFQKLPSNYKDVVSKLAKAYYLIGQQQLQDKLYREAINSFETAQHWQPDDRDIITTLTKAYYLLGQQQLDEKKCKEALASFEKVQNQDVNYENVSDLIEKAHQCGKTPPSWILIAVALLVLLVLTGGAAFFIFSSGDSDESTPTATMITLVLTDTPTPTESTSTPSATPEPDTPALTPSPLPPTDTPTIEPAQPPPTETTEETFSEPPATFTSIPQPIDTPTPVLALTPTFTPAPTPTFTPVPLSGKIAVPVFENGTYNIYLASADNGWTLPREPLFIKASQPAFTKNGSGMTLRSWKHQDWAQRIIYLPNYLDVTSFRPMTTFVEDAHPSLNSRNEEILFHTWPQGSPPHIIRFNINANIEDKNSRLDLDEGEKPAWLGDDKIIFFHGNGLYIMDKDNNNRQLLLSTNDKAAISVAPDNDRVTLSLQKDDRRQIFTLTISQGQESLTQLTKDPELSDADKYLPTWSPDGSYIAFVSNPGGNWAVWVMRADGSEPRELFRLPGSIDGIVNADSIEPRTTFGWWEERMSWAP